MALGDFGPAEAKVRQVVRKAAAVTAHPKLAELAKSGDIGPRKARKFLLDVWPEAPSVAKFDEVEAARVRLSAIATKLDANPWSVPLPRLKKYIVRNTVLAVCVLLSGRSPTSEQSNRFEMARGLAQEVLKLVGHAETVLASEEAQRRARAPRGSKR